MDNFKRQRTEKCAQYCPLECNTIEYTFSTKTYYDNKRRLRIFFYDLIPHC